MQRGCLRSEEKGILIVGWHARACCCPLQTPHAPTDNPPRRALRHCQRETAAANGDTAMLELLLERGFAIGSNALAFAAKNENADMMKVRRFWGGGGWDGLGPAGERRAGASVA